MLKKFIIALLGSLAGVWIAIAIGFFCILGIVNAFSGSDGEPKTAVKKHSALYIDLTGNIPERFQPGDIWQLLQDSQHDGESLVDILESIRLAASDSKIEGIYIHAGGSTAGMASREEIVNALRDFKKSGKWVVAYSDTYSQGDYMVAAAVADSLYLNPVGAVDIHGMASQTPFFKELFEKLGVKVQVVRVGTFKSAVEPFIADSMSEASRLQNQVMVDSLWQYATGVISAGRHMAVADINGWADSLISTWPASQDLSAGVVSELKYRRKVDDVLRELCDLGEDDDLRLVSPSAYLATKSPVNPANKHVAVLFAVGDIVDSGEGGIVGDQMVPEIIDLADNDKVGALVLRINSGGGSAFASEQIWEALEYFKSTGKPFYVSMGDAAASGGYYIACGADRIYADRTTITGSIGVFGMIPDLSGLVTDKIGVRFSTVSTNPDAVVTAPYQALTPVQKRGLQRSVEDVYDLFTSRVAQGRGMEQDSVKVIAEGRVWSGGAALKIGLVDQIGDLRRAILDIAAEADIDPDRVVAYPAVEDRLFAQILRQARSEASIGSLSVDASTIKMLRAVEYLRTMSPVQASAVLPTFY